MNRRCFGVVVALSLTPLASTTVMAESRAGTIVVSDNYYPYGSTCSDGRVVVKARCDRDHCDNNILKCDWSPYPTLDSQYGLPNYTSEEYFNSQPGRGVCPNGYALVGMESNGRYSDNIRSWCQRLDLPPPASACHYLQSELAPITDVCNSEVMCVIMPIDEWDPAWNPTGNIGWPGFLSGFRCTGRYCDNMYYSYQGYACIY